MMKEKKGKGKKTDSTTPTSNICDRLSGDPGNPVQWQGIPASCTSSPVTSGYPELTFPFTPARGPNGSYSMSLATIGIGSTPGAGITISTRVAAPQGAAVHSVNFPLAPAVHPRARGFQSKPSAPAI
jgi:hypothetical protein